MFNVEAMPGASKEVMLGLFLNGPTWDGNLPSKSGRDWLVERGYVSRIDGWSWLTNDGTGLALELGYGRKKDQRDSENRRRPPQPASADGIALILSENIGADIPFLAVKIAEAVNNNDYAS